MNKLTAILRKYILFNPSRKVEVIIELSPFDTDSLKNSTLSRQEKVFVIKDAFQKELKPVEEAILHVGGDVKGVAWANQTVKASIPAQNISTVAKLKCVTAIDLPRMITRE